VGEVKKPRGRREIRRRTRKVIHAAPVAKER
jgi:hypothetical protein